MRIGIVGYSFSGKTTVFELLTGAKPERSGRPNQVAVAHVIEPRLDLLVSIYQPKKVVHATIEFVDLAGLSKTDHSVNPGRLATLREADAMLVVVGAYAGLDPVAEARSFEDDLLLADMQLVSDRIERLEHTANKPKADRDAELRQVELLRPIRDALELGRPLSSQSLSGEQERLLRAFQPLTWKPRVTLINLGENSPTPPLIEPQPPAGAQPHAPAADHSPRTAHHSPASDHPSSHAADHSPLTTHDSPPLAVPAKLELELQQLEPADRQTFMAELGLAELSRERLLLEIHRRVGHILFFTGSDKEVRSWSIAAGTDAVTAAGKIHTDMARGFIRAEVVGYDDLSRFGSFHEVKAHGVLRLEGRHYVIQDGDTILFRFSV